MPVSEDPPTPMPTAVLEALQLCRDGGVTDMSDIRNVLRWLRDGGRYGAADWVEANPGLYRDSVT